MAKRALMLVLLGCCMGAFALAQAAGSLAKPPSGFHLNGVLVSGAGRSALVNGKYSREGDRVGGVEILAIEERAVRILVGTEELTVPVGSTVDPRPSARLAAGQTHAPARRLVAEEKQAVVHTPQQTMANGRIAVLPRHHPVGHGETLSGIAEQYLSAGITSEQVMMALFDANPQAFSGNINRLYAGAMLRIPDENELRGRTAETALADVRRHTRAWRGGEQLPMQLAQIPVDESYGPVSSGETLSAIAESLLHDGVTIEQMMIALFEANPAAFSDNINILYAGAVLRIPDTNALSRQAPKTAAAEVLRHTDAWRSGYRERAPDSIDHDNIIASNNELTAQTDRSLR